MNMILFTINLLIVSLLSTKKTLFRDEAVLENENDPGRDTIYGEFIVFFKQNCWTKEKIDALAARFKECYSINNAMVDEYPDTVDHWIYMDKKSGCDYEDEIEIEWDDYCIKSIEEDERVEPAGGNQCLSRPVESALWNLNTVCPAISDGIEYIQYDSLYPLNMDIVVMDSGIDTSHSQFAGITIERIYDAYPTEPALGSHGTHCAGTILSKDYGAFRVDSNTQIKLIDVRIFPTSGTASSATVLNGYDSIIDYLNKNPDKKVVINMSFGGGNWVEYNNRLATIRSKGGISIAAAGNDNVDAADKSPASSPDTITVGATDQNNNKASFSNYGGSVDIWAAGVSIKSTVVGGGTDIKHGTSMATPLVVGITANILANNPNLDFNGIKQRLLNYAIRDVNDGRGNTNLPRVQASCEEYFHTIVGTIRPQDNTKCLDVNFFAGENVYVHSCHFGTNQEWRRGVPDSDGFYTLISEYNNKCLDAHPEGDGIVNSGDNIYSHPCHGDDNQKWKIDGGIIRNKANGRGQCLDVGDANNNVHIWSCDYNNVNQRVNFIEQTSIRSKYQYNKCMDVNSGAGDNVYLHDCDGGTNQEWRRGITDSDGYYALISEFNNECLDAHPEGDGIVNAGDNIYTHPCHADDNQKWKIDGALIKNKANGGNKCVDGGDQGNNVHIWDCNYNSGNQLFEYPGMSSSASSALSIGNMLQMDDIQFMNADKSIESGKYLYILVVIGILLILINLIGFGIYFCKRNNTSKKGYKVVSSDSKAIDLENPDKLPFV